MKKPGRIPHFLPLLCAVLIPAGDMAAVEQAGSAQNDLMRNGFSAVARKATPAVVSIRVEKTIGVVVPGNNRDFQFNDPFDLFGDDFIEKFFGRRFRQNRSAPREFRQEGQGSGFIISKDGYILSNHHVVGDADKIFVKLRDGREFKAKRIGTDPQSEVALIKIDAADLPFLELGDSAKLETGEWVIAIGNPFGLAETLTVGVVSAKGRSGVGIADYEDFIQTDAAINPGNSGGPLLGIDGRAVGINTAIYSRSGGYMGIGFAIPIDMAKAIKDQLIARGRVLRGYLGVVIQEITPELAKSFGLADNTTGVLVADVQKGSPADEAGLKIEDVITHVEGGAVEGVVPFRNRIASTPPGSRLTLSVLRGGLKKNIAAKIGTLQNEEVAAEKETAPEEEPDDKADLDKLGLTLRDLNGPIAQRLGYSPGEGVLVGNVDPDGLAARHGIQRGEIITAVNRIPVSDLADARKALAKSKKSGSLLLRLKSGNEARYVAIALDE